MCSTHLKWKLSWGEMGSGEFVVDDHTIDLALTAALILADKSDVRRSRVQDDDKVNYDIHDRVNYSVKNSILRINRDHTAIKLKLEIDTRYL